MSSEYGFPLGSGEREEEAGASHLDGAGKDARKVDVHGFAAQRLGRVSTDDTAIRIAAIVAGKGGGGGHNDQPLWLIIVAQEWS
jgi:hypothetical protein